MFDQRLQKQPTLHERFLRLLTPGDVHDHPDVSQQPAADPNRYSLDVPPDDRAVLVQIAAGAYIWLALLHGRLPFGEHLLTVFGMDGLDPPGSQGVFPAQSSHAQIRGVAVGDTAAGINHEDADRQGFHNGAKLLFAFTQGLLGPLTLRDVSDETYRMRDLAQRVVNRSDTDVPPDDLSILPDIPLLHFETFSLPLHRVLLECEIGWPIVGMGDIQEGQVLQLCFRVPRNI